MPCLLSLIPAVSGYHAMWDEHPVFMQDVTLATTFSNDAGYPYTRASNYQSLAAITCCFSSASGSCTDGAGRSVS